MQVVSIKLVLIILAAWLYLFSSSWALAQPSSFTVTGEVDLFANPSGNQIGKLIAGKASTFTFIDEAQSDGKEWIKIPLEGWIKKTSTTLKKGDSSNIRVMAKKDNLLAAPNKPVSAVVSQGTKIEVLEANKNWLKVRLVGWLPTAQTNLPLLRQPQIDTTASPSQVDFPSSESQQKIDNNQAIIEKSPATLERLALQEERSASTLRLLKDLEEKLTSLANLDNQIKRQSEQQVVDAQSILEQLQNIKKQAGNSKRNNVRWISYVIFREIFYAINWHSYIMCNISNGLDAMVAILSSPQQTFRL